jgi:single-strand DNA-binding protein
MDINSITIVGRLTRDPELTYTPSNNTPVCRFSIAVNGYRENDVSFFDITAWNKQAETIQKYLAKGSQVIVNGILKQERFQTKDGDNRSKVGITANSVQFVGAKKQGGQVGNDTPSTNEAIIDDNETSGEIPF